MKNKEKYDWLIIVFVHEIDLAGKEAEKLITEVKQVGAGNNKVFLIRDHRRTELINGSELKVYFRLELSELITEQGRNYFKTIPFNNLAVEGQLNNTWKNAFGYIFKNFKDVTKRKLLLTWSHGSGFGINKEENSVIRESHDAFLKKYNNGLPLMRGPITQVRNSQLFSEKNPDWVMQKDYDVTWQSSDKNKPTLKMLSSENPVFVCKNLEILWIWELAEVLEANLGDNMIDIVLMVNCNMQMLDTGFMLRKKVRYLVGPETEMPWFGYDYGKLFSHLKKSPDDSVRNILRGIKRGYIEKYYNQKKITAYLHTSTIFVNKLKYYDKLVRLLEESLKRLLPLLNKDNIAKFRELRFQRMHSVTEIGDSSSYDLIDMGRWLKLTSTEVNSFRFKWIYYKYKRLLKKIVFQKFIGSYYTTYDEDIHNKRKYGIMGVSLFFPEQKPFTSFGNKWGDCAYYSTDTLPSPFTAETTWDDFIKKFFEIEAGI